MRYPVVINKDEGNNYTASVVDMPGCFSAGNTCEEALRSATKAIEYHIEGLLINNETPPQATSIDQWMDDQSLKDGIWAFVEIDLSQISGNAVKIEATFSEQVLSVIDLYTKTHPVKNRSSFLAEAALDYMARNK